MAQVEVKQSGRLSLLSHSGLALLGQYFEAAQVDLVVDRRVPVSQGMRTSDLFKSVVALLSLGKSDFEAIDPFRQDRFFKESLGLAKVPGSVWMRQRLDAKAAEIRECTDRGQSAPARAPGGADQQPPGVRMRGHGHVRDGQLRHAQRAYGA